jgi:hypothetical protein
MNVGLLVSKHGILLWRALHLHGAKQLASVVTNRQKGPLYNLPQVADFGRLLPP